MIVVLLNITSNTTDPKQYTKLLKEGDSLVAVIESGKKPEVWDESIKYFTLEKGNNEVELYNQIVKDTDESADILLLSDQIDLHDCNLETMISNLHAAQKHAISYGQEIENNKSLIETAKKYLPNYTITIQASACCALIKRAVINTMGFLDASYNSLQYALMDYYCRLNIYGYSSIISHHFLYSYNDKKSDDENIKDKELFLSKYEHWEEKVIRNARHGTQACVEFLDFIDSENYPKKRILLDCAIMPTQHCGTSEYQISICEAFCRLFEDKYDIYIYVNVDADAYHNISGRFKNVIHPNTDFGKFHLGFTPNQLMFHEYQSTMNKHCLKIVQTMFDVMMVRIDEHLGVDVNSAVELGIKLCDGILFISENTKNDFLACFPNEPGIKDKSLKVIYPATGFSNAVKTDHELPFEEYYLIVGNSFKHKGIQETINNVSKSNHNFIVVGAKESEYITPRIYGYKGGHLDDDFLSYLYMKCKAVIFPSLYEGFGLPVVISFKNNKRVIVNNNDLNRELLEHFKEFKDHLLFFDRFEQIIEIIDKISIESEPEKVEYTDTWDRVAIDLESYFDEILKTEVDATKLNERWHLFKLVEANLISFEHRYELLRQYNLRMHHHVKQITLEAETKYKDTKFISHLLLVIKEHAKYKLPGLFKLIKRITGKSVDE